MTSPLEEKDILEDQVTEGTEFGKTNVIRARILKLDPYSSHCYSQWAVQLLQQRQYLKAKRQFKRSIQISPENLNGYDNWLDGLYFAREFEEVILTVERYPGKFQFPYNTQNTVGICYLHLGDYDNAIKSFEKAISMKKDCELAYFNWALALHLQGKKEEALEMYEKAKNIGGGLPMFCYQREVGLLREDLKREENKIFEDLITRKIEGFKHFIEMEKTEERRNENNE